ncbi:MAG: type II toxin-antitoxin system HicB family antitoxin [Patescibacteria group bacterium]
MKNKSLSRKILKYTAIFEPAEEGGYVVSVPALPGCVTQGETFEEATAMVKDAMKGYLEVLKEEGQEIPQEQSDVVITQVSIQSPTATL